MNRRILGDKGEEHATKYLIARGMKILERNYCIRGGEIDIIAMDGDILVFVEVKTRKSLAFGTGAEAIDTKKKAALLRTAEDFVYKRGCVDAAMRFDVADIYVDDSGAYNMNYIENADIWE